MAGSAMRILMLTDYYPPHAGGGVETVVHQLARGLAGRGHEVRVFTLGTRRAPRLEESGGVTVQRVPAIDLTRLVGVQFAASAHVLPALARAIGSFRPDVVHAHNLFFRTTESAAVLRRVSSRPLMLTLHLGGMAGGFSAVKALTAGYEATAGRCIIRSADRIAAVSNAVADHARRRGAGGRRIDIVPNGVDAARFRPSESRDRPPAVVFVGRLVPNKGPETLIKAAPAIAASHSGARIRVVGDGPQRGRLERLARRLGVADMVEFEGYRKDVPEILREATMLVRPSTLEGLPLTVLEAMASGLPVVATPVGGTPELIDDGETGRLVPVGDEAKLAEAVNALLASPERAQDMGARARAKVEQEFTWDRMVDRTETIYREMVPEAARP